VIQHQLPGEAAAVEFDAAVLQAAVTLGLAVLFAFLYRKTRKPLFAWFALAWALYLLRLGAIGVFLRGQEWLWLYWHQVITGWTALALLGAALVIRGAAPRRAWFALLALFPLAWSYIAIYRLDNFLLAALPAVLFLSAVTLATGWIFRMHARAARTPGAGMLAVALILWGLHHLDYPFLRARGAWVPWGYYLDIVFTLVVGAGGLLLVLAERSADLERLQRRMAQQHEEERRRLSLLLHDETAQVFTGVKLQLGVLRERAPSDDAERLGGIIELLDEGLRSIRNITNDLRPSLLDDLGLVPALRALAAECAERYGMPVQVTLPERLPLLGADAELALYRALQEALANVAEHAAAHSASVSVRAAGRSVVMEVADDGRGFPADADLDKLERMGHLGIAGMRERLAALGGSLRIANRAGGGAVVSISLPVLASSS
jgi:signal transduction histidine kinase